MILCYLLLPTTVIPVSSKLSWPLLPLRTGELPTSISSFMQPTCTPTFTIILLMSPGLHDCSSRYCPQLWVFPTPFLFPFCIFSLPTEKAASRLHSLIQSSVCSDWAASTHASSFWRGMLHALFFFGLVSWIPLQESQGESVQLGFFPRCLI